MNQLLASFTLAVMVSCCYGNINLHDYLQPDDILDGGYDNYELNSIYNPNICTRVCDGRPKLCYYKLVTERYSSMGPACGNCSAGEISACFNEQCVAIDGIERGILTFNRRMPGPSIQVCLGDTIVVDAENSLPEETLAIHWHGIRQKGTQYYDGVPKVTQCPIQPGTTFRYQFKAEAPGTYFYHSHSSVQKVDGLAGTLIVRQPIENEVHRHLYDHDLPTHVMYIQDWMHIPASEKLPGLSYSTQLPDLYLFNGRGIFSDNTTQTFTPRSEFIVEYGKRYRMRIIGGTCLACTSVVTFEGHSVIVINADAAGPVEPVLVNSVTLNSGDRFDVILEANKASKAYWIVVGPASCSRNVPPQMAILRYAGYTGVPDTSPDGLLQIHPNRVLNPSNSPCNSESDGVCMSHLRAVEPANNEITHGKANVRLLVEFGFYFYTVENLFRHGLYEPFFIPAANLLARAITNTNVTFELPSSALISQYHDIPEEEFCDLECYNANHNRTCICTNVIDIPLHATVECIITDTAPYSREGLTHPFHLHGYNFHILEMGIFKTGDRKEEIKELNRRLNEGELTAQDNPIQKDTIGVPSGGYVVAKFIADNPGFWFMHCHFTYHLDLGMASVFRVGELSDLPPVPKGFPTCGHFKPPVSL